MKTIKTSIHIGGSPSQVWETLTNFPEHARWNPFFASIEGAAIIDTRLKVTTRKGDTTGFTFKPTITDVQVNRLLRWKGHLLAPGIFDGTHEFHLEPDGVDTVMHHHEAFRGILVPFVGKILQETEEGFVAFNKALAVEVASQQN